MTQFFPQVSNLPYTNCQRCNTTENLYLVSPVIPESDIGGFLCPKCLDELALFAGYVAKEAHDSVVKDLNDLIVEQLQKINAIPKLIEKVIDGTNNILADFIVDLASVTSVDNTIQPESDKADTGLPEADVRKANRANQEHEQNNKPSPKSAK